MPESLRTNFDCIDNYLKDIEKEFHVIAISATWLESEAESSEFIIKKYSMFNSPRLEKKEEVLYYLYIIA